VQIRPGPRYGGDGARPIHLPRRRSPRSSTVKCGYATPGIPDDPANVISIGARNHAEDVAIRFVEIFLDTPFSGAERHSRRIAELAEYEASGAIAGKQTT
jgi:hypothetical protein